MQLSKSIFRLFPKFNFFQLKKRTRGNLEEITKERKEKNRDGRLERKQRKTGGGLRERREVRTKNRGGLER
jgi:hypothetical protein